MGESTYYDVLGLEQGATEDEIKDAFRELTKQYHPDLSDHEDADELFKDIEQAKSGLLGESQSDRSLGYEWDDGTPTEPVSPDTDSHTKSSTEDTESNEEHQQESSNGKTDEGDSTERERETSEDDTSGAGGNRWQESTEHGGATRDGPDGRTGAKVEDGPDVTGGTDDDSSGGFLNYGNLTRREAISGIGVVAGTLYFASQIGNPFDSDANTGPGEGDDGADTGEQTGEEFVPVEQGDSIQEAIERARAGGVVEVSAGTYEESLTITKPVQIRAPDGATLDGHGLDDSVAVDLQTTGVALNGLTIVRYSGGGIVTSSATGGENARLVLENIEISDTSGPPISVFGERVELGAVTVTDTGKVPAGVEIRSSSSGDITIKDVTVERTSGQGSSLTQDEIRGRGLHIIDGETVTVENVQSRQNFMENLVVEADETRGQTVEIRDTTLLENTYSVGLRVTGSSGEDEVVLKNIESRDHDSHGISVAGQKTTLESVEATENGKTSAGIEIQSDAGGEVTVRDVIVERTSGQGSSLSQDEIRGRGLHIIDGETVTVENVQSKQNFMENLVVEADEARGQTVEIRDATLLENTYSVGLRVTGSGGEDQVTLENVESREHDSHGISVAGQDITLKEVEAIENRKSSAGIEIRSDSSGTVTVNDVTVERTDGQVDTVTQDEKRGRGLHIIDGETVTVENVQSKQNFMENLVVEADETRSQTIEIRETTLVENSYFAGLRVIGSNGEDRVTLESVESRDHKSYGFDLGGETIEIRNSSASGNGNGALKLRDISEDEATITNSFENSE